MSDKKIADLNQLKLSLLRSRADTTGQVAELAETVADALTELENGIVVNSSTEGSTKKFRILVDDTGRILTEVVQE